MKRIEFEARPNALKVAVAAALVLPKLVKLLLLRLKLLTPLLGHLQLLVNKPKLLALASQLRKVLPLVLLLLSKGKVSRELVLVQLLLLPLFVLLLHMLLLLQTQ